MPVLAATAADALRSVLARRSHASGALGAVACGSPVAAGIGIATLLAGGNCFDAAVAAALAETVCLAPKCGLGGDLVALVLAPGASEPQALVAVGPAGAGLGSAVVDVGSLPPTGGLSVGVPGAPAGYSALAARGALSLQRLSRPAIELARRGFTWTTQCAQLAAEADALLVRHQPDGCAYRPARGPLEAGSRLRLPGMAALLTAFASLGPDLFGGQYGEMVVAAIGRAGGVITSADLRSAEAQWLPAVHVGLDDGHRVWATPGPTYGPALLRVLGRSRRADPAGLPAIVAATLAEQSAVAGDGVDLRSEGTSVVAATDADGGAVVVVHSNSFPQFGSGVVVEDLDLVLSNRAGRGFASDPSSPNFPRPQKRPLTTLHAWALGGDRPTLLGGTPGGLQQVAWNAQFLRRIVDGVVEEEGTGSDRAAGIAEALVAPLWRLDPDGLVAEADDLTVDVTAEAVPVLSMRSAQVAVSPPRDGAPARAWADPRSDTLALAI